jgi:hypothetical protein
VTDKQPDDLEDRVRDAYQSAARTVQTLQRTSPELATGPVRRGRPRRMNAFVPIAAAVAVLVVIVASVAVPRLLTGADRNSLTARTPGSSAPAAGRYPPFQVVVTVNVLGSESKLQVESAATGRVLSTVVRPWQGATWGDVVATQVATKFIVTAVPSPAPNAPTRLYTLTLSAHGAVTGLRPLAVLPGELSSLAASADGSTVAYTTYASKGNFLEVGVITGGRTRQWSMPSDVSVVQNVSVSGDGDMLAVTTNSNLAHGGGVQTAWVLRTDSAPGKLTARARKVYDYTYVGETIHAATILEDELLSPDGGTLYLCLVATAANARTIGTTVAAVDTADGASLGTIATLDVGAQPSLIPVGGLPLVWYRIDSHGKLDPTGYLLNPATRTKTTLRLHGISLTLLVDLAW